MRDLYLRFADAAEWEGMAIERDPGLLEIDGIGLLYGPPGEEGGEAAPMGGWHVNLRCADERALDVLEPYRVHPAVPRRIWA